MEVVGDVALPQLALDEPDPSNKTSMTELIEKPPEPEDMLEEGDKNEDPVNEPDLMNNESRKETIKPSLNWRSSTQMLIEPTENYSQRRRKTQQELIGRAFA